MIGRLFVSGSCRTVSSPVALASFVAVVLISSLQAPGQVYWSTSSGDWSNPANWGGSSPTSSVNAYIANGGTATVTTVGPVCENLFIGEATGDGTVQMTGGSLSAGVGYVGCTGTGTFNQFGGINSFCPSGLLTTTACLYLAGYPGSNGTYNLSGGQLVAFGESIGSQAVGSSLPTTAVFHQTGGANSTTYLQIGNAGSYQLDGGTLQVNGSLVNNGVFDGGDNPSTLIANNGIIDLTAGDWTNLAGMSVNMGVNSLLIVPAGFDTSTGFASYSSLGFTHTAGTTLVVPAGQEFIGTGSINDPVVCQGSISVPPNTSLNLNNGLILSGTGSVYLTGDYSDNGNVAVNDAVSGMGGGSLYVDNCYVGKSGTGVFTHSGGSIGGYYLYLGYFAGDSGTYNLSGNGPASFQYEYVGYSGAGSFVQTAGTNCSGYSALTLGYNAGSTGSYNLTGSGLLSPACEYVGWSGTGIFNQSGGTHTVFNGGGGISPNFFLGYNASGNGTYNLSGTGLLSSTNQCVGYSGSGTFNQFGGSNSTGYLYLGYNSGGSGTFNQSGGTNSASALYLGYNAGANGTYNLSGSGVFSAGYEYIGYNSAATALFQQTGLANATTFLGIGSGGKYELNGGTLQVSGDLLNNGVFDGGKLPGTLMASGLVDLTSGTWSNFSAISLQVGANSLLVVPAGFDPSTRFASYTTLGLTHTAGTTLNVAAGQGFSGCGAINDPVVCQGTITAISYFGNGLNLNSGLVLSGTGCVSLNPNGAGGNLTVNDAASGMSGGSLSVYNQYVGNSGTGTFSQSGGTSTLANALYLGFGSGDSGSYSLNAPSLLYVYSNSRPAEYIGYSGTGSFTQTAGTNSNYYGSVTLGANSWSVGYYSISGSASQLSAGITVGGSGTGYFTQAGGNLVASMVAGYAAGGSGTYQLLSGSFSGSTLTVGSSGVGYFTQTGGSVSLPGNLNLGLYPGGLGICSLSGKGFQSSDYVLVGVSGTGNFTQSGGTNSPGTLSVSDGTAAAGTYNLSGSGLLTAVYQTIGLSGNGIFNQSGGTNSVSGSLDLGEEAGSNGTYNLSGNSPLTAANENIGVSGSGIFNQSGGTNSVSGTLNFGSAVGGSGIYILSGSGRLAAPTETVGNNVLCTFIQSGGTNSVPSLLGVGYGAGTYSMSGSGLLSAGTEDVGVTSGTGSFTQSGGTNSVSTVLCLGYDSGSRGTYNLSGGLLVLGSLTKGSGSANFNFSGGTLQASKAFSIGLPMTLGTSGGGATFDTAGFALTLSGSLSGSGSLTKVGSGTLTLAATNTYAGSTAVEVGILSLTGSLSSKSALAVGGGTFSYAPMASGGTGNSQTVAGLMVNAGASIINTSTGNTLALGRIMRNTGGVVGFNSNKTGTITTSRANTNGILGPWATYGSGTSMNYAAASGSSAPYTIAPYTGATAVTAGVMGLADTTGTVNYALSGGGGTLTAAVNANSLQFTGTVNTITAPGSNSLSLNGIMNVGSGVAAIAGRNLNIGAARELTFTGPGNVTVGTAIGDNSSGASAVTMAADGTLVLSGANTYSGNTLIDSGTIALANSEALQNSTLDTSGNGALSFGSLTAATFGGLTGPGTLGLANSASSAVALSVGNNNTNSTFAGMLKGAGSLTKVGSGLLLLSGGNTYSGNTTLSDGTLVVTNVASIGASSGSVSIGPATLEVAGNIADGRNISLTDPRATIQIDPSFTYSNSGTLSGTGGLSLTGPGTLILSGSNTYGGGTNVDAGTLEALCASAIPDGTNLAVGAGGTFVFDPSFTSASTLTSTFATSPGEVIAAVPEPSTLVLLAVGAIGIVGCGWRWRFSRRTAKPSALDQPDVSSILSFPSHSSPAHAARRVG